MPENFRGLRVAADRVNMAAELRLIIIIKRAKTMTCQIDDRRRNIPHIAGNQ